VGLSGGIMRTGPRSNTRRWRSRSDRSGSGAPIGPSSVTADSHTAALAGLESHLRTRGGCRLPAVRHGPVGGVAYPEPAAMAGGGRARGVLVMWGVGVMVHIEDSKLRALRSPWRLMQLRVRARRHPDRGAWRATVLTACSAAVVILVSAGVSAAFELNQVRTTHYGWLNNRCGSGNETPGDCISTKGQTESFRANISSDGSFEHPTTLAVSAQCLHGRRACPLTRSGYLRSGDLVFIPDLGWFRVEDTCGACEAGQSNEGAIALWTATAAGTGIQPGQLDQRRPTVHVFHPKEPIPDALKTLKANPDVWQPLIWTNARYMTGANAPSLFVDLHLKRLPASAPARSSTPAEALAPPQDATRPAEPTRPQVESRPPDPARPQEAETADGSAAVDWLLNGRR
jgi:hypothetical protein